MSRKSFSIVFGVPNLFISYCYGVCFCQSIWTSNLNKEKNKIGILTNEMSCFCRHALTITCSVISLVTTTTWD